MSSNTGKRKEIYKYIGKFDTVSVQISFYSIYIFTSHCSALALVFDELERSTRQAIQIGFGQFCGGVQQQSANYQSG